MLYSTVRDSGQPGAAGTRYAPPGGDPPSTLFGLAPVPERDWLLQALRRGHRAPPRGVDVKQPLRTGSGRPRGA